MICKRDLSPCLWAFISSLLGQWGDEGISIMPSLLHRPVVSQSTRTGNLACLDNCEKRTFNYKISATFSSPHRPFHWLLRWLAGWLAVDGGELEELGQKKFTVMIVVVSLSLKTAFIALESSTSRRILEMWPGHFFFFPSF